jgi:DNA repair exonuclease SbcCD nuclease subunit
MNIHYECNFKINKSPVNNISNFSFIHASDIHIGSNQYRNTYRADDFIRAFNEILKLAIYHCVDFILLGGDVFTSLEILPEKLDIIISILKKFINTTRGTIPIIAIEGNHDIRKYSRGMRVNHGQSWLKFIANLGLIILLDGNINNPP